MNTAQRAKTRARSASIPMFTLLVLAVAAFQASGADQAAAPSSSQLAEQAHTASESMIAWATVALAVITAVLALYTAKLWKATVNLSEDAHASGTRQAEQVQASVAEAARGASAMEELAKQAAVSADAAQRSVQALKERTAQQMRAYLSVSVGNGSFQEREKGIRFEVRPVLTNAGHTPARRLTYWAQADVLPFPLPDNYVLPQEHQPDARAYDLGPHQSLELNAIVQQFYEDDSVIAIKRGTERRATVWGVITYWDVFGEQHETKFAHSIAWVGEPGKEFIAGTYLFRHNEST